MILWRWWRRGCPVVPCQDSLSDRWRWMTQQNFVAWRETVTGEPTPALSSLWRSEHCNAGLESLSSLISLILKLYYSHWYYIDITSSMLHWCYVDVTSLMLRWYHHHLPHLNFSYIRFVASIHYDVWYDDDLQLILSYILSFRFYVFY